MVVMFLKEPIIADLNSFGSLYKISHYLARYDTIRPILACETGLRCDKTGGDKILQLGK